MKHFPINISEIFSLNATHSVKYRQAHLYSTAVIWPLLPLMECGDLIGSVCPSSAAPWLLDQVTMRNADWVKCSLPAPTPVWYGIDEMIINSIKTDLFQHYFWNIYHQSSATISIWEFARWDIIDPLWDFRRVGRQSQIARGCSVAIR